MERSKTVRHVMSDVAAMMVETVPTISRSVQESVLPVSSTHAIRDVGLMSAEMGMWIQMERTMRLAHLTTSHVMSEATVTMV